MATDPDLARLNEPIKARFGRRCFYCGRRWVLTGMLYGKRRCWDIGACKVRRKADRNRWR